ncbi:MAG: L,D-transpeptidase family protein [Pseudomonadota bacterium]
MVLKNSRFAGVVALAALAGGSTLSAQISAPEADPEADNMSTAVAAEVEDAIEAIDPTTGGASLMIDPSLPQPYIDEGDDAAETTDTIDLTRGPAARIIAEPQAQAAPVSAPAPVLTQAQQADPFVVKSILPIAGTIRYGEWYWDESRAPADGKLVVTVDLDARVISVFRDGHEIGTAVALLGTERHPTPLGTFPILTKERDNVSEKYNNAPMPWTLRLTWSGIAIHGSPVMNGYASHGCIGVPDPFAEKLFAIAKRGDKVVITRGQYIGIGDKIMS